MTAVCRNIVLRSSLKSYNLHKPEKHCSCNKMISGDLDTPQFKDSDKNILQTLPWFGRERIKMKARVLEAIYKSKCSCGIPF